MGESNRNVKVLFNLVTLVYTKEAEGIKRVAEGIEGAPFAISLLATKLGECPESLGMDSVYGLLEDLADDVQKMESAICKLRSPVTEAV